MGPLDPDRQPGSVFWRDRFGERTLAGYFEDYFHRTQTSGADGIFFYSLCRFTSLPAKSQAQTTAAMKRVFGATD